MFSEGILDKVLAKIRKLIPKRLFNAAQPAYHWALSWAGAFIYGFPSKDLKVIGITGTKGKSTTVFLVSKIFDEAGIPSAAVGSLGFKIKEKTWPNNLKMTMPGRFKLQKFFKRAKNSGVKYVALEVTSEGIKQKRHLGINFDCAVLTNIHKEHLESHGTFENYVKEKKKLFYRAKNTHILNEDDLFFKEFKNINSREKKYYKLSDWDSLGVKTNLVGDFNKYNILAAFAVAQNYGIDKSVIRSAIEKIDSVSGRMEFISAGQNFEVVIDYAHTPDSLIKVYETLKNRISKGEGGKLICVLGSAGGGRDKWKRPEFGKIAAKYCDKIILTNEDPFEENPESIIDDIVGGISGKDYKKITDRSTAIKEAVTNAYKGDIVVITGKGSENSIAVRGGRKIPWSDKEEAKNFLESL